MDKLFDGSDAHLLGGLLPRDVARCTGERLDGACKMRGDCLRFTDRENAGPLTNHFEPPTDARLETGCALIIADPHY